MQKIEFTNIRITTNPPLHPELSSHPYLSLRLVVDGEINGETTSASSDPTTGVWEINPGLCAHSANQSVTLEVFTGQTGHKARLTSVYIDVTELLGRVKEVPDGYQEFDIGEAGSSIQLLMTCLVKASPSVGEEYSASQTAAYPDHTFHGRDESDSSDFNLKESGFPSRDYLESLYAKAIRMKGQDDTKACKLSQLGYKYHALYNEYHRDSDLEKAISMHEEAMQFTGLSHPRLAEHAHRFSMALLDRFQQTGDPINIERAISYCQTSLNCTGNHDADKPDRLRSLGTAFQLRFQRLGNLSDIDDAITNHQKAIELTPDGHPEKPALFSILGGVLRFRFERLGNPTDIDDAISNHRKAVNLTPFSHPDKAIRFSNLGNALQSRFKRLGSIPDIEDAISSQREAIKLTPDRHPDKPGLLSNLGIALQSRFGRLGGISDVNDTISSLRQAIALTPDGHPNKPGRLNNLGNALQLRFEHFGSLEDIDDAILSLQEAVELTPFGHPDKPSRFNNLGRALLSRFRRLDHLTDMDSAIENLQQAIELTPDGLPIKAGRLYNLGNIFLSRFQRFGDISYIDNAISSQRKATELTPDNHPDKPKLLSGLGSALRSRFGRLGSLTDMHDAISNHRKAVALTPDGHPIKSSHFNNLGAALLSRFQRLGQLSDMDEAVLVLEQAVKLTPDEDPRKPSRLNNLGTALKSRFERRGILDDVNNAVSTLRKAVEITPDGHPDKLSMFNSLGNCLRSRFERLGTLSDIDDAILNQQKAVELGPEGHPNRPNWLYNLGIKFLTRFERTSTLGDLESGLSLLSTAARSTTGSAMTRFNAARQWAKTTEKYSRSPLEAFGCTIDLLPRIAWLGLSMSDQHALLADVGGIVRDAVAAAVRYEEYETAVEWAEQGRSIAWQNLLGLRSPVDHLRTVRPELADQLQSIARQLESSESHDLVWNEAQSLPIEDIASNHSKLALEWENLVDEIRRIPDFEGFLRAKGFNQLAPVAHEGPVVILNVSGSHCDALVLIADDSAERRVSVVNIPLERFSYDKSKKLFKSLTDLLSSAGVRERNERKIIIVGSQLDGEAKFKTILHILWQDVVKPVIEGLAFQTASERPPRIWWCATGLLTFLPIHAAGRYGADEIGEKVSEYVVSSYTPTLTAILELPEPAVQEDFQILMVAQASAPGASPIPKTEDEARVVRSLTTGARCMSLMRKNATVKRVREGMMESNWIHLACHGQQHPDDPMESGFLLHDKILKLSEIVKMSLPKADFAFLSACQTAMGDEKVAEESVHLAAGMFLSGCRGVIATTWSIRDDDAPKIAEGVYSRIFKEGRPNRKEAAYALHEAVKRLRDSGAQCTSWVPFIHIGR